MPNAPDKETGFFAKLRVLNQYFGKQTRFLGKECTSPDIQTP